MIQFQKPVEAEHDELGPALVLAIQQESVLIVEGDGRLSWHPLETITFSWRYEEETADWMVIGGERAQDEDTTQDDRDPEVS